MRGFSLRQPVAFYRSHSDPSLSLSLYLSLSLSLSLSLLPSFCVSLSAPSLPFLALHLLHHCSLEWGSELWERRRRRRRRRERGSGLSFVAAWKPRLEIWLLRDMREPTGGHAGYDGNQSQIICRQFSPPQPRSFEICLNKASLFEQHL